MTDVYGPAMLGVTTGLGAFMAMLPKLSDIRRANMETDPAIAADVRMGEVAGVTLTMGIGLISSSLARSPIPTYTALIMSVILVGVYESALRSNRPFERHLSVVPSARAGV